MSIPKTTKVYILANPPAGEIQPDTFKLETRPLPAQDELKDGEMLVKTIAFSNDPAQRGWMDPTVDPKRLYVPPINKGDPVRAGLLAEVVASKSDKFKKGMLINGWGGWAEYNVIHETGRLLHEAPMVRGQSEFISMSLFGLTGMTAYAGVFGACKLEKDNTVVVSGAAGGVGSVFIQIAKKVVGCKRVVGIAGGKEKCDWVKSLGADECVDYKDANFAKNLAAALPDYADVFFDNVGGDVMDKVLTLIKRFGKLIACGAIEGYHGKPAEIYNWREIVFNRITIIGFYVWDHADVLANAIPDMKKWIEEGTIDVTEGETVVETKFEDIPKTWQRLFDGRNKGKLVTKLVS